MNYQQYLQGTPTTNPMAPNKDVIYGTSPPPTGPVRNRPLPGNTGPQPIPGYNERPGFGMPSDFQNWLGGMGGGARGPAQIRLRNKTAYDRDPYGMTKAMRRPVAPVQPMGGGVPMNSLQQMQAYMQYANQGKALDQQYQQQLTQGRQQQSDFEKQILKMGPYTPNRGRVPVSNPYLPQVTPAQTMYR